MTMNGSNSDGSKELAAIGAVKLTAKEEHFAQLIALEEYR